MVDTQGAPPGAAPIASAPLLPVPPYTLDPLLFPALPQDDAFNSPNPNSPAALSQLHNKAVRCAEGDRDNLYVGTSDGVVHAYALIPPPNASSSSKRTAAPRYRLQLSRLISNNAKPVEKILLLADLPLAAVLCEGVLSFYTLPSWTPARGLPSTRAVSTVVLDDDELINNCGLDGFGMVSLCIVRRKNILLAKVGQNDNRDPTWAVIKDIPLPGGAIIARRHGDALCIANTTEYSLVNLSDATITQLHLPISQTGESPSAQVRPSIVSIPVSPPRGSGPSSSSTASAADLPKCEFLVTSHSGSITLGVFVTPSGDPTPKLLEWPSHPRSLVYASDYVFSLLRNDTIEVHDVRNDVMEKVQTEHLPPGVEPRFLTAFPTAAGPDLGTSEQVDGTYGGLDIVKVDLDAPSTSSLLHRQGGDGDSAQRRSQVVLCGRNSIHTLDQDSLMDWGLGLLKRGHLASLEEALLTVAEEQRQHRQVGHRNKADAAARLRTLQYSLLLQALTLEYLQRARFWDAGETFSRSGGDPRLLIAFSGESDGGRSNGSRHTQDASEASTGSARREAIVPAALREHMERFCTGGQGSLCTVEDLIRRNLAMNYCPPLDAEADPVLLELADVLTGRASDMLLTVLRSWRTAAAGHQETPEESEREWCGFTMDDRMRERVAATVDGTLLKLLAERASTGHDPAGLDSLLSEELACSAELVTEVLEGRSYLSMLADVYLRQQRWGEVLEIWTGLIDGRSEDRSPRRSQDDSHQPTIEDVAKLLATIEDPLLTTRFGKWLVKKDPKAGVEILTRSGAGTNIAAGGNGGAAPRNTKEKELAALEGHRATLAEIEAIDTNAADGFVENIVLAATKIQDAEMHERLLRVLVRRVEQHLSDAERRATHVETATDYAAGSFAESFFAHLALAVASQPGGADRLKLAMFLQGSAVLDLDRALEAVSHLNTLAYERAIVLGKLGRDREALELLAIELRDANSAEAYCSQDGAVLSPMLAGSVAEESPELQPYAALVSRAHQQRSRAAVKNAHKDVAQARLRKEELLKTLLTIYMENGKDQSFRTATAHLLNTQALYLDSVEILRLVPDDWPLSTLETFLSQSLRRQRHRRAEAEVTRSIAVCRDFDVAEDSWARLRAMGGVLQDTDDVDGDDAGSLGGAAQRRGGEESDDATVAVTEKREKSGGGDNADDRGEKAGTVVAPGRLPPTKTEVHDIALDDRDEDAAAW
ncbi:uncharacterized protein PFL1_03544 [Pseudozyma flocculosa PF-1]|uniref:Related to TGF beta receptor associated protein-1 n=2 Tax=Pseudozyma flocculosa TaxID=84751 RepID=A0A5C3F708_9BASI|nr:uncharacterized protein PFL1_03544 [Pseudozyma flocculosa PF-1]EPQ28741.1 hypothetical protein PFL1_03544 [Pseudozyma flocculosa PF-1]SPO39487.1 related to TGF beta receptor associated protein-1 [Pseudozyma flocculosa]